MADCAAPGIERLIYCSISSNKAPFYDLRIVPVVLADLHCTYHKDFDLPFARVHAMDFKKAWLWFCMWEIRGKGQNEGFTRQTGPKADKDYRHVPCIIELINNQTCSIVATKYFQPQKVSHCASTRVVQCGLSCQSELGSGPCWGNVITKRQLVILVQACAQVS